MLSGSASNSPVSHAANDELDPGNASSDMNEVDFDKERVSRVSSPKVKGGRNKKASKASLKLAIDKKKLEKYVGEGEQLLPVPRARRRMRGGDMGYMVKRGDTVVRYIDKDGVVYMPNGESYNF